MGLLTTLLTFPVAGPIKGLGFIAGKVAEQAMDELLDESRIQRQLMELELRHDLGEFDDEEYAAREEKLLEQMDAIQEYREEEERRSPVGAQPAASLSSSDG